MHSVTSRTAQSVHLAASPVIKSFTASSSARVLSGKVSAGRLHSWHWPEVKANAEGLSLKAKAKTKDLITEAKAKAEDLTLKAKAKDIAYCPRGALRLRTWPQGLQHCALLLVRHRRGSCNLDGHSYTAKQPCNAITDCHSGMITLSAHWTCCRPVTHAQTWAWLIKL